VKKKMVSTLELEGAPECLAGLVSVAAICASGSGRHRTHALELASFFPLDVETVDRMLGRLDDREGVEFMVEEGVRYLVLEDVESYHVEALDLEAGEHLERNASFRRHLERLGADEGWRRKTREQHELLCCAAGSGGRRVELSYFTKRLNIPSSRVQSLLNDLSAGGHVRVELDEEADKLSYVFPVFSYPRERLARHLATLEQRGSEAVVEAQQESKRWRVLMAFGLLVVVIAWVVASSTW
jgi:hypothetical protein